MEPGLLLTVNAPSTLLIIIARLLGKLALADHKLNVYPRPLDSGLQLRNAATHKIRP